MRLALCLFLTVTASARAETFVLQTPVDVWDVTRADLNGDGYEDIIAYCSDATAETPSKELAIFLAEANGKFPLKPTLRHPLRPDNGTVFITEYDGVPPVEIVEAEQSRGFISRLNNGILSEVGAVEFNSLLPNGSREPVFAREVAADLDGDGVDEWLLPAPRDFLVLSRGELRARVPAPTSSEFREYGNQAILHRLPAVTGFALPDEQFRAIALLSDRHADFSYGAGWDNHFRYSIPARDDESWDTATQLKDLDGDGVPDLVVTNTKGTISLEVTTQVFFADGPFSYRDTPDATFVSKGSFTTVEIDDVDGDGKQDLILLRIPLGVRNIISYLLRKRVSIEVSVHYLRDRAFRDEPDRTASITIDAPDGREQSAYVMGDFDGDGRLDVAIGTSEDTLAVYRGGEESFLSSRPWQTLTLPTFGVARTADLNANGADDIVLHHPSGANQRRIEVILF